jgi:hypothetical protein
MNNELKFKSKIAYSYVLYILGVCLIMTQTNSFIKKDFLNKRAWLIYLALLIWFFILNLFFSWSIEISSGYFKVKFPSILFFLKPKIYNISDIDFVNIRNYRNNVALPSISIKLKNEESIIKHYFFLINTKSMKELFYILRNLNINTSIAESAFKIEH